MTQSTLEKIIGSVFAIGGTIGGIILVKKHGKKLPGAIAKLKELKKDGKDVLAQKVEKWFGFDEYKRTHKA